MGNTTKSEEYESMKLIGSEIYIYTLREVTWDHMSHKYWQLVLAMRDRAVWSTSGKDMRLKV